MIPRYTRPEMRNIWTDANKLTIWLQIELLASEALAKQGVVPEKEFARLKKGASYFLSRGEELFTRQKSSVRVVCGGFAAGKTIAKPVQRFTGQPGWDQRALVEVCTGADGAGVIAHYLEVMTA